MEIKNDPIGATSDLNDSNILKEETKSSAEGLPCDAPKTFQRKTKGGLWIYVPHKGFTPHVVDDGDSLRLRRERCLKNIQRSKIGSHIVKTRGFSISDLADKISARSFSKCLRINLIMNNICAIKRMEEQNCMSLKRLCRRIECKLGYACGDVKLDGIQDVLTKNSQRSMGVLRGLDKIVQDFSSIRHHDGIVHKYVRIRNPKLVTKGLGSISVQKIKSNFMNKIRIQKLRAR